MTFVVVAEEVTKNFGALVAVNGISFRVQSGETFGILGENGAGKSTTMRMIACRSPLSAGQLWVGGFNVQEEERKVRSIIGVVPQENNLDPDLNVRENLLVYSKYFRLPKQIAESRTDELLDFIKLKEKTHAKVDHLSGGMRRRLIIARALLHCPKILLLDEPTTGLDPNVRQEIWEKLEELRRREKITILLSTHYMEEAEKLCQRLIIMAKGIIIAEGVPRDLIRNKLKRYALEVREAGDLPLLKTNERVLQVKRGNTHLYFAENTDELTPLIDSYASRPVILRPSNLEDVFLKLVENNRL